MRGRKLAAPKGRGIRPTSDRVREALFSLVGQDLEGLLIMDLFAGTGAIGIEALSRGGQKALFVDNSLRALALINTNLELCGLEASARVIRWDLRKGLPGAATMSDGLFDLVFMDPPYGRNLVSLVLKPLSMSNLLGSDSLIMVETASSEILHIPECNLSLLESRAYGDTTIHILAQDRDRESKTIQD